MTDLSAVEVDFPEEIYSDWLPKLTQPQFTRTFPARTLTGGEGKRSQVVNEALRWLGIPYVWGGSNRDGVDCSGLVQQVFAAMGKQMPRVSYQQTAGQRVAWNTLQPGDLVGWDLNDRNNGADHVAIYIGNGWIIEAPRPGLFVRKRKLGRNENAFGVQMDW